MPDRVHRIGRHAIGKNRQIFFSGDVFWCRRDHECLDCIFCVTVDKNTLDDVDDFVLLSMETHIG